MLTKPGERQVNTGQDQVDHITSTQGLDPRAQNLSHP